MSVEADRAGEAIAASAGELARLWRATVAQVGKGYWPGLLDGVVEDVFRRLGEGVAEGGDPTLVWPGLTGVVRLDARAPDVARAALEAEWDAVDGVIAGAREALRASAELSDWLARALAAARSGARALAAAGAPAQAPAGPPGVVVVRWLSAGDARRPRRGAGRR